MKYIKLAGIAAAIILMIACFLPWAYYPDLDKTFTGFYSENNAYGKPGKAFLFLGIGSILLFMIPRLWAKRTNLLLSALILGYSVKNYLLFTACYRGTCPEKKEGIYILFITAVLIVLASLLPDMKLKQEKKQ